MRIVRFTACLCAPRHSSTGASLSLRSPAASAVGRRGLVPGGATAAAASAGTLAPAARAVGVAVGVRLRSRASTAAEPQGRRNAPSVEVGWSPEVMPLAEVSAELGNRCVELLRVRSVFITVETLAVGGGYRFSWLYDKSPFRNEVNRIIHKQMINSFSFSFREVWQ